MTEIKRGAIGCMIGAGAAWWERRSKGGAGQGRKEDESYLILWKGKPGKGALEGGRATKKGKGELSTLCLGVEQPRSLHATNTMIGRRPRVEYPRPPEKIFREGISRRSSRGHSPMCGKLLEDLIYRRQYSPKVRQDHLRPNPSRRFMSSLRAARQSGTQN